MEMEYSIFKLKFETGLHAGNTLLEDSEMTIHADTLFSALCHQAVRTGGETLLETFVERTRRGELLLSDAFPYDERHYYIAKPMIERNFTDEGDQEAGNSDRKKQDKKMKFIPLDAVEDYISGSLDAKQINRALKAIGVRELRTQAAIRGKEDTLPFHVGVYHFRESCGLYFIAGHENEEAKDLITHLFESLEFDGIGGERSSGLGRFVQISAKMDPSVAERLSDSSASRYISLSVCLPEKEEMAEVLEGASYSLLRRGGFVQSEYYAPKPRRRKDLYVLQAGSSFCRRFSGNIYDVSSGGTHPVYRYAKPLMMGVRL